VRGNGIRLSKRSRHSSPLPAAGGCPTPAKRAGHDEPIVIPSAKRVGDLSEVRIVIPSAKRVGGLSEVRIVIPSAKRVGDPSETKSSELSLKLDLVKMIRREFADDLMLLTHKIFDPKFFDFSLIA
jgi:hypothetical protein